ncbi:hypothetical protein V6Z12_D05G287300 [Gossypium hirsutum]
MERSEPALVPEWLRSTGTVTGGGNSAHHFTSSSSNSDVSSLLHHGRHRNSRNISDFRSPRSAFLDRTCSLNSGRSSRNVSAKHAYSSFSRSHRDKDRERDKERTSFGDHWDRYCSEPLESILTSRVEKLGGISTSRLVEPLPRRIVVDSRDNGNSNHNISNGLHSGGTIGSSIPKAVFEKDFPSLGTEERQGVPEMVRVSSPGLSSASQSLPVGNSALIDGEGWTSALAEVPSVVGSSSTGTLSASQPASTSGSGASSISSSLNMAEALAQAPSRTRTPPMLSVNTQRREELAIKQSRQLIPVTPSMPKGSVLNSADKSKAKPAARISETNVAVKSGPQPQPLTHQEKTEVTKEVDGASATAHADENGTAAASNGDTCSDDGEKNMSATAMVYPDEEEAAFLRSLGWEENTGEDEGLTEEEINAFYQEYMKLRPSLKVCRGMQPKLSQSFANNLDGASELSSSDSGSET